MAKPRVHELAKELGVTSKEVLAKLGEMGEFVKSASSTVEAPVARKLKEQFPAQAAPKKSAKKAAPAKQTPAPAETGATKSADAPAVSTPASSAPKPPRSLSSSTSKASDWAGSWPTLKRWR